MAPKKVSDFRSKHSNKFSEHKLRNLLKMFKMIYARFIK